MYEVTLLLAYALEAWNVTRVPYIGYFYRYLAKYFPHLIKDTK